MESLNCEKTWKGSNAGIQPFNFRVRLTLTPTVEKLIFSFTVMEFFNPLTDELLVSTVDGS